MNKGERRKKENEGRRKENKDPLILHP